VLITNLGAAILAGGISSRMGCNKALLPVDGVPLIQRLTCLLEPLTEQVFISANDPVPYAFLGLPIVSDIHAGQGPLAGLHAAMVRCELPVMLLLACDLPRVQEPLLRKLIAGIDEHDAVIPMTSDSRVHPLCAVYRRTCLPAIEHNLREGKNKMTDIFESNSLQVLYLSNERGGFSDDELYNLNRPVDLRALSGKIFQ
jgi:molybdopterin-guanine dinucleotide biosynthesis protein A